MGRTERPNESTRAQGDRLIDGERELWRGQPAWLGYLSLTVILLAAPAVLLVRLVGHPGLVRALAIAGLTTAAAAIGLALYGGWRRAADRYILTTATLRYVTLAPWGFKTVTRTIPLAAISRAEVRQRRWQKLLGVGDILLYLYAVEDTDDAEPFQLLSVAEPESVLRQIRHRLYLLDAERELGPSYSDEPELEAFFRRIVAPPAQRAHRAVTPPPQSRVRERVIQLFGALLLLMSALSVGLAFWAQREGFADLSATYRPDDPVRYPDGSLRPRAEIVAFMKREVMPFAKQKLAPVVGGAEYVTCKTCHGDDAKERDFKMPAVSVLPYTRRVGSMTRWSARRDDVQIQNALVGDASDYDNAETAEYMKRVILPGMAALLRRPVYDRARSYEYNKTRGALGCYHCHRLHQTD